MTKKIYITKLDEKTKENEIKKYSTQAAYEREMRKKLCFLYFIFISLRFPIYLSVESFRVSTNGNKHHVDNR